jgi:hypothetical protein
MALVHQIIDFVDDIDRSILKEAGAEAPDHLKEAKILTAEEREKLEPGYFALVMRTKEAQTLKKFPINDEANTWLSCRYFEKTSEQLPYVAQKIAATQLKRACAIYNIVAPESISKLASQEVLSNHYDEVRHWAEDRLHAKRVKVAQQAKPDGSSYFYALGNRYAMPSADYVKKASEYFLNHMREFTDAEDRSTFASNVQQRAKELQVVLEKRAEDSLKNYAGDSYGDSIGTQLKLREELLSSKPMLAGAVSKFAFHREATEPEVFAKALFLFDKKAGLTRYYDGYLADAFKATFGTMIKRASGYQWEDESSGLSISGKDLEKAASSKYEKIRGYFGVSIADQLKKHAVSIFDSLPKDAQETIVKIAKGVL